MSENDTNKKRVPEEAEESPIAKAIGNLTAALVIIVVIALPFWAYPKGMSGDRDCQEKPS